MTNEVSEGCADEKEYYFSLRSTYYVKSPPLTEMTVYKENGMVVGCGFKDSEGDAVGMYDYTGTAT